MLFCMFILPTDKPLTKVNALFGLDAEAVEKEASSRRPLRGVFYRASAIELVPAVL